MGDIDIVIKHCYWKQIILSTY